MSHSARLTLVLLVALLAAGADGADDSSEVSDTGVTTTTLWLFDEPVGLYPSHVLDDSSDNDMPLTIGIGAQVVEGLYGNSLLLTNRQSFAIPEAQENPVLYGLEQLPPAPGRTQEPLSWFNAEYAAFMTSGEKHLRVQVGFVNPTTNSLNLGDFDWTVEFWHTPGEEPAQEEAVVFELGSGPRGENDMVTQLKWLPGQSQFVLVNQQAGVAVAVPSEQVASSWRHYAFTYEAQDNQVRHYVDGVLQPLPERAALQSLPFGEEAYFSLARDGRWGRPLTGMLDELRFSQGLVYSDNFEPPASFAVAYEPAALPKGPAPLFDAWSDAPLQLGSRKHVFIDGAIFDEIGDAKFVVNPPKRAERVLDNIEGTFRKHLTVVEDEEGLIRIYNSVEEDHLAVYTSRDGINFERPDLGKGTFNGHRNIVIPEMVGGLGNPFIEPHAHPQERWKYFTDYHRRGIYLYTSPDGYNWTRNRTLTLPFRSGTQSSTFYDDQRQVYVSFHRSGIFHTPAGDTQRSSVVTEHKDLRSPLPFQALSQQDYWNLREQYPLRDPLPWFTDNGPLTPGGFGMEYPHVFDPTPEDPPGVDFYLTKSIKYPWAADTYLAFPVGYFHYENDGPPARRVLGTPEFGRGSGPLESQIAVSRNGLDWHRYPEPAYVGIGRHEGRDVVTAYIAQGMVLRGEEIWQYYFGETHYHSPYTSDMAGRGAYRLVQRLDGFVSLDSPYGYETTAITKPLVFEGSRLVLNVDTDAVGYMQVGLVDEEGEAVEGFSVDDCIYINGDFIATEVEWLSGKDVSKLAGNPVQMVLRMRGTKLYAMQFVNVTDS